MPGISNLATMAKLLTACSVLAVAAWAGVPEQKWGPDPVVSAVSPAQCGAEFDAPAASELFTLGEIEQVLVSDGALSLPARIDTGATTTSFGVNSTEVFDQQGESWVRFSVVDPFNDRIAVFERPLVREARIKRHVGASEPRLVVTMPLTIGPLCREIEVTLANRDKFMYPVLVGRNFLHGHAMVDVSRQFVALGYKAP